MINNNTQCLLVEDEPLCSYMTSKLLEELSCVVDVVETAKAAYELLQKKDYDIVFMDIGLPDQDGFELAQDVRNNLKLIVPIIAITGHVFNEEQQYFLDRGLNDVIYKPASITPLHNALEKYVSE